MRIVALFLFLLSLAQQASASDPDQNVCMASWIWNESKSHLGWPFTVFDFAHPALGPLGFAEEVNSGRMKGTLDALTAAIKIGAAKPIKVVLAGPRVTIEPILRTVSPSLMGLRLPYLTFLLIGPPELEKETDNWIRSLGGTFAFIQFEEQNCSAARP